MYTKEDLESTSFKRQCEQREEAACKSGQIIPDCWKKSSEIFGFLSKEKLNEVLKDKTPEMLLTSVGVAVFSDKTHCFFVDDVQWGNKLYEEGFCSIAYGFCGFPLRVKPREELPSGMITTAEELLMIFHKDEVLLNSVEELLEYLNRFE